MSTFCQKKIHLKNESKLDAVQTSFDVTQAFSHMQQGLVASYDHADFIYVLEGEKNNEVLKTINFQQFKEQLASIIIQNCEKYESKRRRHKGSPEIKQLLISSFETKLWNQMSKIKVDQYTPIWNDPQRSQKLHPNFTQKKKSFYKFDIKMFFQIKKNKKGCNHLTQNLQKILQNSGLTYIKVDGHARQFCGVKNAIIAGRFNDGVERPKDPYSLYLHTLIGYNAPQHLGGTYLLAQKCRFQWSSIHMSNESLPSIIGRNQILKYNSSIFSQHHCPRSHIRLSRIKDDQGNPVSLFRESKTYTTSSFDPAQERDITDNINPEQGIFFIAYHKNPLILQKMMLTQLGNNAKTSLQDGLLNLFKNEAGNILYTPNTYQLLGKVADLANSQKSECKVASLASYHQIRWLKNHSKNQEDEQLQQLTGNPYFLYSRAGYMQRMSQSNEFKDVIDPPSPRILRILSRTFSLWQDTWYFDRKQREIEDLQYFLQSKPEPVKILTTVIKGFHLEKLYKNTEGQWNYTKIPMAVRNGLAIHYLIGHIMSTLEYGCRGPVDGTVNGVFGGNTFHLEPEDILAGGAPNLSFGQGKNVMEYLTEDQKQQSWRRGSNISAQSGVGHVVPYMEEIIKEGLGKIIDKFRIKAEQFHRRFLSIAVESPPKKKFKQKAQLFAGIVFALLGFRQYFKNYSNYAKDMASRLKPTQIASIKSLKKIQDTMMHLSNDAPRDLHEGAQLTLSLYICLHLSGEPVSIGRLDHILRKFAKPIDPQAKTSNQIVLSQEDQDIIDSFWIKVGEKPNFNTAFFEDHQKWGNLAMGGNSIPFPQGASFNQWGQQLTVGGSNQDNSPFYNSITVHCLRSARTIPMNAPCLGLRLMPGTPKAIIEQAAEAILAGGAHPVLLNEQKIIAGLRESGNYVIPKTRWDEVKYEVNGKEVIVPYTFWKTTIDQKHIRDFTSDGCHEFLIVGRSWFWLAGGCTLQGLEYVINVGKSLIESGPQYIHGKRNIYRDRPLSTYKTYEQFEQEYFDTFEDIMRGRFEGQLSGYSNLTKICPATLLNPFTSQMFERQSDFYANGTEYKLFCPQYTGFANLTNALWNIKQLVFEQKITTLQEVRNVLLVNWGDGLIEPFVTNTLPNSMKDRLKYRCDMLRLLVWKQPKFGSDKTVTQFGFRISRQLSKITRKIFQEPTDGMLRLFKQIANQYGSERTPFGFQYLPGCGTFEGYQDSGAGIGASFDGRKKGQSLAEDYSPQNFLMDKKIGEGGFDFKPIKTQIVIQNYTHSPVNNQPQNTDKIDEEIKRLQAKKLKQKNVNEKSEKINQLNKQIEQLKAKKVFLSSKDPQLFSGAVLDLNIDQSYKLQALVNDITSIANGKGTNLTTITVCSRQIMEQAINNTDRDLLRFRMGGWSEFAVSMFPNLMQQQIRRVREIHPVLQNKKINE